MTISTRTNLLGAFTRTRSVCIVALLTLFAGAAQAQDPADACVSALGSTVKAAPLNSCRASCWDDRSTCVASCRAEHFDANQN